MGEKFPEEMQHEIYHKQLELPQILLFTVQPHFYNKWYKIQIRKKVNVTYTVK